MKARIHTLLLTAICLTASLSLSAQEQGQTQGGGGAQGASVTPVSSVDSQGIRRYLLGPGDTLDVRVFGQPDLNWQGEVDADGTLTSLPFIETPIRAQCKTDKEVQKEIIAAYSRFLKSPQISVRVTGRNSRPPAMIFGAVPIPTRVQMFRRVRLNELITQSGGYTERANGDIQILHLEPIMCPEQDEINEQLVASDGSSVNAMKVYKLADLLAGKPEANPVIRPGDVVTVMEAKPVYITGSVVSPQPLLLRDGLTLSKALAMVGGVSQNGVSKDVRIYRSKMGSPDQEVMRVDFSEIKKKKSPDVVLQAYDIIEVPKASDWKPSAILTGLVKSLMGSAMGAPGQIIQYKAIY
jgi:polysaccharide biosynthesis/export protein